jgi:DNA repair protein RadC
MEEVIMRIVVCEQGIEYKTAKNRTISISTPQNILEKIPEAKAVAQDQQECFCICCLDAQNGLINMDVITRGILHSSLVHPREVFAMAIEKRANSIILVHNHPSGKTQPSAEDIMITKNLIEAGKILDIKVLDSVIITKDFSMLSVREEGLINF